MQNTDPTQDIIDTKPVKKIKRPRKKKKITRFLVQTFNLIEVS